MDSIAQAQNTHSVLVDLLKQLCKIPAPSNEEGRRAAFCKQWFAQHGMAQAYIDDALNVVVPFACEDNEDIVVVMAHTDTVFPDLEPMPMHEADGKLFCPGVGDDTANLAVLMMLAAQYATVGARSKCTLLFVANAAEEGLGNLKGSRQILKDFGSNVKTLISLDGYMNQIYNHAVGSHRYRVEMCTEGGHSFSSFGNRNAIATMASLIDALYRVEVPKIGNSTTTYNVGAIEGGTSVNTIAQHASMLYEYRSDTRECLAHMRATFEEIVDRYRADGIDVHVTMLGERPCTGDVDRDAQRALTERAADIIEKHCGTRPRIGSGSTDCNVALDVGIPAICFGAVTGGGAHTREEWVDLDSLKNGYAVAKAFLDAYFDVQ